MKKEMSEGEGLYELVNIFLEIAIEQYEKTGEHLSEDLGKRIDDMSKKEIDMYLHLNDNFKNGDLFKQKK